MSSDSRKRKIVGDLIEKFGRPYTEEAGVYLKDKPAALFQLLVLSILSSARIRSGKAVHATKALLDRGWTSPKKLAESSWEQRTQVLNESGYARYDESTARVLGQSTHLLNTRYSGDLRKLREAADRDPRKEAALLKEFKGIGEMGASIFLREAQVVWPEAYPHVDAKASEAAEKWGLPKSAKSLSRLVDDEPVAMNRLLAALIRVDLEGGPESVGLAAN